MKTPYLLLFISSVILIGCGKPAHTIDSNYLGIWQAYDGVKPYEIDILEDSEANCFIQDGEETHSYSGTARIKNNELKIGKKKFNIDTAPYYDSMSGNYIMVLDGLVFTRIG